MVPSEGLLGTRAHCRRHFFSKVSKKFFISFGLSKFSVRENSFLNLEDDPDESFLNLWKRPFSALFDEIFFTLIFFSLKGSQIWVISALCDFISAIAGILLKSELFNFFSSSIF